MQQKLLKDLNLIYELKSEELKMMESMTPSHSPLHNTVFAPKHMYLYFSFKDVSFPWKHKFFCVDFDPLIGFYDAEDGVFFIKGSLPTVHVSELVVPVFLTERS